MIISFSLYFHTIKIPWLLIFIMYLLLLLTKTEKLKRMTIKILSQTFI